MENVYNVGNLTESPGSTLPSPPPQGELIRRYNTVYFKTITNRSPVPEVPDANACHGCRLIKMIFTEKLRVHIGAYETI